MVRPITRQVFFLMCLQFPKQFLEAPFQIVCDKPSGASSCPSDLHGPTVIYLTCLVKGPTSVKENNVSVTPLQLLHCASVI